MMTLYSRADDARCHRVRFVLAEKALEVRVVNTDPTRPPEDLIDLNPYQTVPTLVDRELVVYEWHHLRSTSTNGSRIPAADGPGARAQSRLALKGVSSRSGSVGGCARERCRTDRRDRERLQTAHRGLLAAEPLFKVRRGSCPTSSHNSTPPSHRSCGDCTAGTSTLPPSQRSLPKSRSMRRASLHGLPSSIV
jgi:hypothetical protein